MADMTVGIDLDLTLRDINTALVDVYLRKYPEHKDKVVPISNWNVYSFTPYFPIGRAIQNFFADNPDEINSISKPFYGAKDFMKELSQIAKVSIVTFQINDKWKEVSLKWLQENDISFHEIIFLKDKTKFEGKFLLDDCIHTLKAVRLKGNSTPVCRDYPWNQQWDGLRIKHYDEFLNIVRNNLALEQINN